MAKPISQRKRAALAPLVLEALRVACKEGAPTPSYLDLVRACRAGGVHAVESEMSAVLDGLEADGWIERLGKPQKLAYRMEEGETVPRSNAGICFAPERMPTGPTLEERAAAWGRPLELTHPSDRATSDARLPTRPFVSGAGRWQSPLA